MIPITEAAKQSGKSVHRLQVLCKRGRIPGAQFIGRLWMLPESFTITPGSRGPKIR